MATFDLPLTGKTRRSTADHTVSKPVYPDGGEGRQVDLSKAVVGELSRRQRPEAARPAPPPHDQGEHMLTFDTIAQILWTSLRDRQLLVLFAVAFALVSRSTASSISRRPGS